MQSKKTGRRRMNYELQSIKNELQEINEKLQSISIVKLDDAQMEFFLNELTERFEWSTNKIVDETKENRVIITPQAQERKDGFSFLVKLLLGFLFIGFGVALGYILITQLGYYWNRGWGEKFAMVIFHVISLDCVMLGIDIFRERDRNYLVSMFSALVALVALIITIIG